MSAIDFLERFPEANQIMNYYPFENFVDFWEHLISKDQTAWRLIHNNYTRILFSYLQKKHVPSHEIEDIVQTVLLKFWERIMKSSTCNQPLNFDNKKSFMVYLIIMANNEVVSNLRGSIGSLTKVQYDDTHNAHEIVSRMLAADSETKTIAKDMLDKIIKFAKSSPHNPEYIDIFKDYYFKGIEVKDIAQKYSKSQVNVRVILHRLRGTVLKSIAAEG